MKNIKVKAQLILALLGFSSHLHATEDFFISAPIFPKVEVLYEYEDDQYPISQLGREKVVDTAFMSFTEVFDACLADEEYANRLHSLSADNTLTQDQLAENYTVIAECSYNKFTSKPYFIPKLIQDVDICSRILDTNDHKWRMISETDIQTWGDEVYTSLSQIINTALPNDANEEAFGAFYFSMATYINTDQGLKVGNLYPNISSSNRISNISDYNGYCSGDKCHTGSRRTR